MLKMQLAPDVRVDENEAGVTLIRRGSVVVAAKPSLALRRALESLQAAPISERALADQLAADPDGLTSWFYYHAKLQAGHFLWYTLSEDAAPLLTFQPYGEGCRLKPDDLRSARYQLSRFALCRRQNGQALLESPLAPLRVAVHQPHVLIPLWANALTRDEYAEALPDLSPETARSLFTLLANNRFLTDVNDDGVTAEEANDTLYQWTFHDLYFHVASRFSHYQQHTGQFRSFPDHIEPQPAFKPPMSDTVIRLEQPDMAARIDRDPPFAQVVERRRTLRVYDDQHPVTFSQLSEWLYRAARATSGVFASSTSRPYEVSQRAYPSAGACHELEIYLAVRRCEGLAAGVYHYCPARHVLEWLSASTPSLDSLFRDAQRAMLQPQPAQIHVTLTARFQRVSWKYDPIAYALILKNVGVLLHHLGLNAAAMNLGFCPIGSGGSENFLRIVPRLDLLQESPVGEAVLGSL